MMKKACLLILHIFALCLLVVAIVIKVNIVIEDEKSKPTSNEYYIEQTYDISNLQNLVLDMKNYTYENGDYYIGTGDIYFIEGEIYYLAFDYLYDSNWGSFYGLVGSEDSYYHGIEEIETGNFYKRATVDDCFEAIYAFCNDFSFNTHITQISFSGASINTVESDEYVYSFDSFKKAESSLEGNFYKLIFTLEDLQTIIIYVQYD